MKPAKIGSSGTFKTGNFPHHTAVRQVFFLVSKEVSLEPSHFSVFLRAKLAIITRFYRRRIYVTPFTCFDYAIFRLASKNGK